MKWSSLTLLWALILAITSTGCVRVHNTRGNFADDEKIAQIKVGMTQADVAKLLGTPSTTALFRDDAWFYIGAKESSIAFFAPRIESARTVIVSFDGEGHVKSVEMPSLSPCKNITLSSNKTKDLSHKKTIARSIFGNVGRFNKRTDKVKPRVGGNADG